MNDFQKQVQEQVKLAFDNLFQKAELKTENIVVVGCSTSEVMGETIGSASNEEVAKTIFEVVYPMVRDKNLYLALQCCEHLNRALVVESECAQKYDLREVTVVPAPKAGGTLPRIGYVSMENPVVVEEIQGNAGIDIGDTFIGMHLKPVAVPVRSSVKNVGNAHVTMARTRPKLIGGERAEYKL